MDIGNHVIAEENLTAPEDQADIFRILGASGILPPPFAERIVPTEFFTATVGHKAHKNHKGITKIPSGQDLAPLPLSPTHPSLS